jgi:hypothetical protein
VQDADEAVPEGSEGGVMSVARRPVLVVKRPGTGRARVGWALDLRADRLGLSSGTGPTPLA